MTEEKKSKNLIDKLKEHPISVILIVIVSIFAGLGALTESLDKTITFYEKHFTDIETSKIDNKHEVLEKKNTNNVEKPNEPAIKYAPLRIMANQKASAIQKQINNDLQKLKKIAQNGSIQLYLHQLINSENAGASAEIAYLRNIIHSVALKNNFIPSRSVSPSKSLSDKSRTAETGLAIVSTNGELLVATGLLINSNELRKKVISVSKEGHPELIDIISLKNSRASVGFAVPIYELVSKNKSPKVIAVLFGYKNVETYLSPLLKSTEPTIKTDEAMLVGLRNNKLVYLSSLRDGVISTGMTIGAENLHIAAAYSFKNPGQYKTLEDYSGNTVLCTGRKISGLPWVLVQKINAEEFATKF